MTQNKNKVVILSKPRFASDQMRFQREPYSEELVEEMMPLFVEQYNELAKFKFPLKPKWATYITLDKLNILRVFTARDESTDELVGYNIYFIQENCHYGETVQAHQDLVFIKKTKRGFGLKFLKWCDEQLRYDKVEAVYNHVKAAHNFGPMLERLGYELVDLVYARRLSYSSGEIQHG